MCVRVCCVVLCVWCAHTSYECMRLCMLLSSGGWGEGDRERGRVLREGSQWQQLIENNFSFLCLQNEQNCADMSVTDKFKHAVHHNQ